ncbi:ephrin-B2b [Brachyhypopomus gauderio]|uniref:ephrin-B2b n=1 Tax=Brachyhypopomus gauderio TaxID=698409 RepID=UPI00404373D7
MNALWKYLLGLFVIICRPKLSGSTVLESIYWNTSNTKFVPGKGLVLYPQIGDKMDIVCPRLKPGTSERAAVEYFRVYLVTKEQLETCRVSTDSMALLNCDKPDQDVKFTFKFQEFSPNLWGLEFSRGQDYHIISTSNSTLEGLDNHEGGVCKTKSMKLVLRLGQSPADPSSAKEQHPPKYSDSDNHSTFSKESEVFNKVDPVPGADTDGRSGETVGATASAVALLAGVVSGAVVAVLLLAAGLVALVRRRRRHRKHSVPSSAPLPLHALPKRGSALSPAPASGNNNGSEPSDIIFPLRTSDPMYCPHYEKVSGDYGHPVYIVQEMPPQSPANIYYKV